MSDTDRITEDEAVTGAGALRDAEGHISAAFTDAIREAIDAAAADQLKQLMADVAHEADVADLIEALDPEHRPIFIQLLGADFDFTALTELDENVRVQILEELPTETVVEGMRDLDSDDAVYILEDLDAEDRAEILDRLPVLDRAALLRSLDLPEESAGRRMQTDFIAVPAYWSVGQVIDYFRDAKDLPETFYEVFVIDPFYKLLGTLALDKLLRSKRQTRIEQILDSEVRRVAATEDQEEAARLFERYNLVSAPVVDENGRLVGVLTIDDIVDVIQEEAEEDIRALGGVGDEELSDRVPAIIRSRFPWLFFNMFTAFVAASVIGLFDGTIERMVALAVLMPIVASMGGNAGTQAMTVTVRALAAREISRRQAPRVLWREACVGLLNGGMLALMIGTVAGMWFSDLQLGAVIGVALIINMVVAGCFGVLIPLTLDRFKLDPAVASPVFLTTVTDVVGFFAFLGLAAWWFGIGF
ncbi:magnesium transporter MgtE [Agaricicola taiwanensis]|uniref:Magnesium transporter MgtE n=1 Tax=Agaricicola taiwanensis TaxID=591372 RepID=A0A8J2YJ64_9RHOB|nr:magnesium transporter [Agaricicola taiwanensis]GGE46618.1 magnesium transporter MgtE [Agaricicola taiwanensis]